jgi:putative intracellular protease/amidase
MISVDPSPPKPAAYEVNKVLVILFEGFNTLDVNAPIEVLHRAVLDDEPHPATFDITVAAENEFTTAAENVKIKVRCPG